jgi:hypothetical protein
MRQQPSLDAPHTHRSVPLGTRCDLAIAPVGTFAAHTSARTPVRSRSRERPSNSGGNKAGCARFAALSTRRAQRDQSHFKAQRSTFDKPERQIWG